MRSKKINRKDLLLATAAVAVLIIAIALFLSTQKEAAETTYALKGNVTDLMVNDSKIIVGVSNDPTELNFGMVALNMTVQKFIDLNNTEDRDAFVKISKVGNISTFVAVNQEEFLLERGKGQTVSLIFNGTQKGYFNGELRVLVETPKYPGLSQLGLWK